jgi:5-histidylcysteine sulfoxide synthase/putative 4-mercaptohistidine N1-methyltranferase
MKEFNIKTPNLNIGDPEEKRQEILDYFIRTFELDSKLYETLKDEKAFYRRADPLRHPLIFYFGHTMCFFVNKLVLAGLLPQHINREFESMFAIGVDEMSWDDLNEQNYNWPKVDEVRAYRQEVKSTIIDLIKNLPLELPVHWNNKFWPIIMGIEHQNIHIETSSVLIRQLPLDMLQDGIFDKLAENSEEIVENELVAVKGKNIQLGKPEGHKFYGWDLEYGNFSEDVEDFKASKYLVSNAEFFDFVKDDGYHTEKWWTEEGWSWKTYKKAEYPLFWRKDGDDFKLRLMTKEIQMPWSFPVEINYLEAKAFCNWKSAKTGKSLRLPTEAEWYSLVEHCNIKDVEHWETAPGNINLEHYTSPSPVSYFNFGDFYDVMGNVWQWTETPITGYPGFKVHPLYDDFSTPTFDGKHNLIKGGSWISTGNEATIHARYAFRRHFYQHAGFRYVESEHEPKIRIDSYVTDKDVAKSCEANYGEKYFDIEIYPIQLLEILKTEIEKLSEKKLLDLNCDTGRLAFEASKFFRDVTAIDSSARYIQPAVELQENGLLRYVIKDEGELQIFKDVLKEDLNIKKGIKSVLFMQDDAMKLKSTYSGYDVILAFNLLEELQNPQSFLKQIHQRLNNNGILIIGSTYNWNQKICPKENWLGGFKKDGEPVTSFDTICEILNHEFDLVKEPFNLKYIERKSTKNFEIKLSEISLWRKK